MMEIIKELMPVCIQAIKSGQTVAIWYILVFNLIPLIQSLINWIFVVIICKGLYSLIQFMFVDKK